MKGYFENGLRLMENSGQPIHEPTTHNPFSCWVGKKMRHSSKREAHPLRELGQELLMEFSFAHMDGVVVTGETGGRES